MMRKTLKSIVSGEIAGVSPSTPLNEVVKLMHEHRFSCVPVLENERPVGIFTERHMVRLLARGGAPLGAKPVSELMSSPVVTARYNVFIYEAFQLLETNNIRHLVVVDEYDRAVGVMTYSDLVEQISEEFFLEMQPITRIMTRDVHTASPAEPVADVLARMSEMSISCMVCAEDRVPLGVVTERDLVRLIEAGGDFSLKSMAEIMSKPALTVGPDIEIHEAARIMRAKGVRRLVVTDAGSRIIGLATQTNLVRGLESRYIKVLKEQIEDRENRLQTTSKERDELSLYLECIMDTSMDMGIVGANIDLDVIYCNEAACRLLDKPGNKAVGRKMAEVQEETGISDEAFARVLEKVRKNGSHSFTYGRTKNEEERYYQARVAGVWDGDKNLVGYVYMIQDITERKKAEENIRYMAYHDILTGLPNRVAFEERLSLELARAERNDLKLAVMVVDLDRFKQVNDTLGHFSGDLLLEEVARRMQSCLRKSDTLARYGGDEFILVLPEIDGSEGARVIAGKLADAMREPVDLKGEQHTATISMGIAIYPEHALNRKQLIDMADQAMYAAKEAGRDSGESNFRVAEFAEAE